MSKSVGEAALSCDYLIMPVIRTEESVTVNDASKLMSNEYRVILLTMKWENAYCQANCNLEIAVSLVPYH